MNISTYLLSVPLLFLPFLLLSGQGKRPNRKCNKSIDSGHEGVLSWTACQSWGKYHVTFLKRRLPWVRPMLSVWAFAETECITWSVGIEKYTGQCGRGKAAYILKGGICGNRIPQTIWNFRRKIVWERKKYQDYTVCRAIDGHFPYLCSVIAINCQ